jgi:hypothetical protein
MAGVMLVVGDMRQTVVWADRADALGAAHGLEVPARVLGFRGSARCALGGLAGLEELRAALALSLERGEDRDAAVLYNNLGDALLPVEGPASVLAVYREGLEFAERRGIGELVGAMRSASLDRLIELGEWDRALEDATARAGPRTSSSPSPPRPPPCWPPASRTGPSTCSPRPPSGPTSGRPRSTPPTRRR